MDFTLLLKIQRDFFSTHATRPVAFRIAALKRLAGAIEAREATILAALHQDLRKPPQEAYASEIGWVLSEVEHAIRHVKKWARPERRGRPRMAWFSRARVVPEPRGVALIMGPWNYPLQLILSPLVGALAAGNCAVLKTSELTPQSARVIAEIVRAAFSEEHVAVVQGDQEIARSLLAQRFDTVFFTGSSRVGRQVMAAAAKHLTPVTLELGGKSPCIVCEDAPVELAARRIIWGKMMNAGQTCVAPDYVLVDFKRYEELMAAMKAALERFYTLHPQQSPDFGRIVNRHHFDRLKGYLSDGTIAWGGDVDADELYIAPTLLTNVRADAAVMTEEIFGPILPIIPVRNVDEALAFVQARPAPLAVYLFTKDRALQQRVVYHIRCGSVCMNDVVVQLFGKDLPFGGVGESGFGSYHGKASFDAFTHFKSVLHCSTAIELSQRYPPARLSLSRFKKVIRFLLRK